MNAPLFSNSTPDAVHMHGVGFAWPGSNSFEISIDQFKIARGERVLLLGPSGAGKSTLLGLICGITPPTTGAIEVLGQDLATMNGPARDRFRAEHFGVIFQMFNLLPYATAIDNVLLSLSFAPARRARVAMRGPIRQEAHRLLLALGLEEHLIENDRAAKLSVGQQQRVAAGRALIGAPELIVADEPTSALDQSTQDAFLDLLFTQVAEVGAAILMVSHDESLVPYFDRTTLLSDFANVGHGAAS